jgi:hypothetical protein
MTNYQDEVENTPANECEYCGGHDCPECDVGAPANECTRCNGKGCYECVPESSPANEWREDWDSECFSIIKECLSEYQKGNDTSLSIEAIVGKLRAKKSFIQNLIDSRDAEIARLKEEIEDMILEAKNE